MSSMELNNICFGYDRRKNVLRGVNLSLEAGKMYAMLDRFGCGKATQLSLMGGLDTPS